MQRINNKRISLAILSVIIVIGGNTVQAETTECTEIPSIPYTIDEQGVYCLTHNLSAKMATGAAITVDTNNVTIDFNGFKLGNLAAGFTTRASGIIAGNRSNVIIRNGILRGYYKGIFFTGSIGGNHLVENMRLDGNTFIGIHVLETPGVTLRNNTIVETGGSFTKSLNPIILPLVKLSYGIRVEAKGIKIIGNDISRVFSTGAVSTIPNGISVVGNSNNAQILNNSVSQLSGSSKKYIFYSGLGGILDGNRLIAENADGISGIVVTNDSLALCGNTKAVGFVNATSLCSDGGGNVAIN